MPRRKIVKGPELWIIEGGYIAFRGHIKWHLVLQQRGFPDTYCGSAANPDLLIQNFIK